MDAVLSVPRPFLVDAAPHTVGNDDRCCCTPYFAHLSLSCYALAVKTQRGDGNVETVRCLHDI